MAKRKHRGQMFFPAVEQKKTNGEHYENQKNVYLFFRVLDLLFSQLDKTAEAEKMTVLICRGHTIHVSLCHAKMRKKTNIFFLY